MVSMPAPVELAIDLERLAESVRGLDPATRALLDLSIRRGFRDDAMAPILRTDVFHLAWRRARALEAVATAVGGDPPVPLSVVRAALPQLPAEAWIVAPLAPRPTPSPLTLVPGSSAVEAVPPRRLAAIGARLDEIGQTAPPVGPSVRTLLLAAAGALIRVVLRRGRTRSLRLHAQV